MTYSEITTLIETCKSKLNISQSITPLWDRATRDEKEYTNELYL